MASKPEKLSAENVAKLCEKVFALPVVKITAPGGKTRESLRVHFPTKTIIATQRSRPGRMRLEIEVLKRLTEQGAPVPAFLSSIEGIFFQEDVGSNRLSGSLSISDAAGKIDIARRTVESLLAIRAAGKRAKLADIVPALGEKAEWVAGLIGTSRQLSKQFKFSTPRLDLAGLSEKMVVPADQFIKWDARPGNASIGKDGKVYWFDWEHCGKRQGMEDFAWLAGDEFWPVGAADMISILQAQLPEDECDRDIEYLGYYITFHIVQRLKLIFNRHKKAGWVNADKAMKFDKIGVDPVLAYQMCEKGKFWADRADLTRPMVDWFEACEVRLRVLEGEKGGGK